MKVIDLLNKIANGEQSSHIRIYNKDWYWNDYDGYVTKESLSTTPDAQHYLFGQYRLDFALDKEVEIIEEPKEIEKLGYFILCKHNEDENLELTYTGVSDTLDEVYKKINELIDVINELKKENK